MAMTWALSADRHDLIIRQGRLAVVVGADEVRQRVLVSLLHYWREYFLNIPGGIPWYELLLGSSDRRMIELVLRRAAMAVPGVLGVVALNVAVPVARQVDIRISLEVQEAGGLVPTTQVIGGNIIVNAVGEQVTIGAYHWADYTLEGG